MTDINLPYEQVLQTYDGDGTLLNTYDYGVQRISSTGVDNETYLYDGRGSVSGVVTGASEVTIYAYTAYGDLMPDSPEPSVYGYNAEETDYTTGLQYLRARYYDTTTGRFIQKDEYKGDYTSPETLNRYTYCLGNPIKYNDPSGYFVSTFFAGITGGTKGQKVGGAVGSAIAFVAVTAAIVVTTIVSAPAVAVVAVGVGVGLVAGAAGDYVAQRIANNVDDTNRPIDTSSLIRSSIYGAIGGIIGGGITALVGIPVAATLYDVLAGVAVNTLVVDPIVSGFLALHNALISKEKRSNCYGN